MSAIPSTVSLPLYCLKLGKSKNMLDEAVRRHNARHRSDLAKQLRPSHRTLLEKMLWMYSRDLARHQAHVGALQPGDELPTFRTSNGQMAKLMGNTARTVINLMHRLKAANLIALVKHHGTNSSYELALSPELLHLETPGAHPANQVALFRPAGGLFLAGGVKSFHHTVSKKETGNPQINQLSGAAHPPAQPESQRKLGFPGSGPVDNSESLVENPALPVDKRHSDSSPVTPPETKGTGNEPAATAHPAQPVTAPPVAAAPPASLPDVLDGLPADLAQRIRFRVAACWAFAQLTLWPDAYICTEQEVKAQAMLAEYFLPAKPERYDAVAAELRERMMLVARWVRTRQQRGEKGFVPSSAGDWLDHRNPSGFTISKPWWRKHMAVKQDIKNREMVTKAVNEYLRALAPGAKVSVAETYRRVSQRLAKRDRELLNLFNQQIANVNQQTPIPAAR